VVAAGGHLECLQFAHENKCPWADSTIQAAADGGHLAALMYAVENGCPAYDDEDGDDAAIDGAVEKGYLEVVKYMFGPGDMDPKPIHTEIAAGCGQLEMLQYLWEEAGCDWGYSACERAAEGGHLEVLKYAVANFCWNFPLECRELAEDNGHTATVEWIDSVADSPDSWVTPQFEIADYH
jgi:hypothetical protein